jgi:hypothetical protein
MCIFTSAEKIVRGIVLWIALCAVLFAASAGAVTISSSASVGAVPSSAGAGLSGSYYAFTNGSVTSLAQANQLISSTSAPTATFTSNTICFPDCAGTSISDSSPLTSLLNGNVTNFSYTTGASAVTSVSDTAMVLTGYIAIAQAGTYTYYLGSDDGSELTIGGQSVIVDDGTHSFTTDSANVTYAAAGLYAISIEYFENGGVTGLDFYAENDTTNQCVIGRTASCAAGTASTGALYSPAAIAPEPGSVWLLGGGLAGLFGLRRARLRAA